VKRHGTTFDLALLVSGPPADPVVSTLKRRLTISSEQFDEIEDILWQGKIINHAEWFCRGGADFIARGIPTHIEVISTNGAEWLIEIEQIQAIAR
jgi:hypothetical protein